MAGLALIMIVGQLQRTTGVPVEDSRLLNQLRSFVAHLGAVHWPTLMVSVGVLAFLFAVQATLPQVPGPLVAVVLSAALVAMAGLRAHGLAVVGSTSRGLPPLAVPDVSRTDLRELLMPAIAVAVVAYTDNVMTARAFAVRGHYDVDVNQELLALAAATSAPGL